jgi:hypothetical protein
MDGRAIWLALWACLLETAPLLSIHCFVTFALINHYCSSGPGPQPLRGMSGFPAQQQAQARNATLASARLPNGKLGANPLLLYPEAVWHESLLIRSVGRERRQLEFQLTC